MCSKLCSKGPNGRRQDSSARCCSRGYAPLADVYQSAFLSSFFFARNMPNLALVVKSLTPRFTSSLALGLAVSAFPYCHSGLLRSDLLTATHQAVRRGRPSVLPTLLGGSAPSPPRSGAGPCRHSPTARGGTLRRSPR